MPARMGSGTAVLTAGNAARPSDPLDGTVLPGDDLTKTRGGSLTDQSSSRMARMPSTISASFLLALQQTSSASRRRLC